MAAVREPVPDRYVVAGYTSEDEAKEAWMTIKDNENLAVVGINVSVGRAARAPEGCVCWCILHKAVFRREHA